MTTQEFSNEFDILYNNIMSNAAPGLTEYEKSVFLTKAQSEVIRAYFSNKGNKFQEGFDDSEKRQYDFSNLIRVSNLFNINSVKERISTLEKLDKRSQVFLFPVDYFLSVNELIFDSTKFYSVIPLKHEEYQRLMLKPYAYPVKRGAWRMFTDKKNCNLIHEYITKKNAEGEEENTSCDYRLLTSWADQKRNLQLTIKIEPWSSEFIKDKFTKISDSIYFNSNNYHAKVTAGCKWSEDKLTYKVKLTVASDIMEDDEEIVEVIKEGFKQFIDYTNDSYAGGWLSYVEEVDSELAKAATHTDGFYSLEAPSKFLNFTKEEEGKTFISKTIQLPIAEVIGKFSGPITYQLRYVRKPNPIVLEDLGEELSIDGVHTKSECELSSEVHSEILQRAVELAKAAYIGDLNSQIALGQTSETNMGIVAQSR